MVHKSQSTRKFGTEMQSAFQSACIGETCPRGSSSVLAGDTTAAEMVKCRPKASCTEKELWGVLSSGNKNAQRLLVFNLSS